MSKKLTMTAIFCTLLGILVIGFSAGADSPTTDGGPGIFARGLVTLSGGKITGVAVRLINSTTKKPSYTTYTDVSGMYNIMHLTPGSYILEVGAGYKHPLYYRVEVTAPYTDVPPAAVDRANYF